MAHAHGSSGLSGGFHSSGSSAQASRREKALLWLIAIHLPPPFLPHPLSVASANPGKCQLSGLGVHTQRPLCTCTPTRQYLKGPEESFLTTQEPTDLKKKREILWKELPYSHGSWAGASQSAPTFWVVPPGEAGRAGAQSKDSPVFLKTDGLAQISNSGDPVLCEKTPAKTCIPKGAQGRWTRRTSWLLGCG